MGRAGPGAVTRDHGPTGSACLPCRRVPSKNLEVRARAGNLRQKQFAHGMARASGPKGLSLGLGLGGTELGCGRCQDMCLRGMMPSSMNQQCPAREALGHPIGCLYKGSSFGRCHVL